MLNIALTVNIYYAGENYDVDYEEYMLGKEVSVEATNLFIDGNGVENMADIMYATSTHRIGTFMTVDLSATVQ